MSCGTHDPPVLKKKCELNMRRLAILLIFLVSPLFAEDNRFTPECAAQTLVDLDGEPTAVVNGLVNAITGDLVETQVDAIIPGADPLILQRLYLSSDMGTNPFGVAWSLNHFAELQVQIDKDARGGQYLYAFLKGAGAKILFESLHIFKDNDQTADLKIDTRLLSKGVTNTCSGIIRAATNLKNHSMRINVKQSQIPLVTGSGAVHTFDLFDANQIKFHKTSESKPNGNRLLYEYGKKFEPRRVKSINRAGVETGSFSISYPTDKEFKKNPFINVNTSDGRTITYRYEILKNKKDAKHAYLSEVIRPDAPTEKYTYERGDNEGFQQIIRKELPKGRFLEIDYYHKGKNLVDGTTLNLKSKDERINRVMSLKTPVGPNNSTVTTHRFYYDIAKTRSTTTVRDALNHKTEYAYDSDHRLSTIAKFDEADGLYSTDTLYWGKGRDRGNLISRTLGTKEGWLQFCHTYVYDDRGNVMEDRIHGNLTGWNQEPLVLDKDHLLPIDNGCESYVKYYTYSTDGKNLKTSESDGRKALKFTYHSGTSLMASKIVEADGRIQLRYFFDYDANGAVTRQVSDDGSSPDPNNLYDVTERHIQETRTTFQGLPEEVIEKSLDLSTGQERLVSRLINHFSAQGRLLRQDRYDSENQFVYSLTWEYDAFGNVIRETNALGQAATRRYDENGNKIFEQGPNPNWYLEFGYDAADRLVWQARIDQEARFVFTNQYDVMGRKIATRDCWGNETRYVYDAFGRLIRQISPPVLDENGISCERVSSWWYDVFGNPAGSTDPMGGITQNKNTIRGTPYEVKHPDGTYETKAYHRDESLLKHRHQDGTTTHFTYDYQGRIVRQELFSVLGESLKTTSSTYNGFRITSETNAAGQVTSYFYDFAGRLVKTICGSKIVQQKYDSLGRVAAVFEKGGDRPEDLVVKRKKYDLLNRITEEWTEDGNGACQEKTFYGYDLDGNRSQVISYGQAGKAVTTTVFNSEKKPIRITDPQGHVTVTFYAPNRPYSETTDPLGYRTGCTLDALGRKSMVVRYAPSGQEVQRQMLYYDGLGNIARQWDGSDARNVTTLLQYDAAGRVVAHIEAAGTPDQKVTRFIYNALGQKEITIRPDGTQLRHSYDSLGRLADFQASDGSFHYAYAYDLNDNLLSVADHVHGTATTLLYDADNNLIEEVLGNSLKLSYSYDAMGRQKAITLSDGSRITYSRCGVHLQEIRRFSSAGSLAYTHHYTSYDESGRCLTSKLIGQAGTLQKNYDLLGRIVEIDAPSWRQCRTTFDPSGNLITKTVADASGSSSCSFTYDDLYQMSSETGLSTHNYESDALYARQSKDGNSYQLNALSELLSDAENEYTYDANGNLIALSNPSRTFAYDALGRLLSITEGSFRTEYIYDSFHRRLSKSRLSLQGGSWEILETTRFLYAGQNEIGSVNDQGALSEVRVLGSGAGAEIGAAVAIELNDEAYAPIHDSSGNVVSLLNASTGDFFEHYRYSSFGEEVFDTTALNPWRFSSKRFDPETGWIFFGRRHYDSVTGRWTTPDPLENNLCPNLYAYVNNNPLTHVDLYGLFLSETLEDNSSGYLGGFGLGSGSYFGDMKLSLSSLYTSGIEAFNNPRLQGSLRAFGGFLEATAGAALAPTPFAPLGMIMLGHGADHFAAGGYAMTTGRYRATATEQLLQKAGMSSEWASFSNNLLSVGGFTGSIGLARNFAYQNSRAVSQVAMSSFEISASNFEGLQAGKNFKSFVKGNCRDNLMELTGISSPRNIHAHHVFPQKYKEFFLDKGINIHDPRHMTWWDGSTHLPNAKGYNDAWFEFIRKNPDTTPAQILEKGKQLMNKHGIEVNY